MPDPTPVIQQAASRGWEAAALALFGLFVVGFLGWLVKAWIASAEKREASMATRLNQLEDFQSKQLVDLVIKSVDAFNKNSVAVDRITTALERRPCLLPEAEQRRLQM